MISLQEALQNRIELYKSNPEKVVMDRIGKEYSKKWAKGVQFFQKQINKEREKDKLPPLSFIAIRQKVAHIKDYDDLRWFAGQCLNYKNKDPKNNSFSKCFFGSLKIK